MSARLQEGLSHQRANRHREAVKAYRDVLKNEPENPDALHFLGLSLWRITQDPVEPLELIERSMELAPGHPHMHHNLASILGSVGQIDEAVGHYKTALQLNKDYAEAYFNLGGIYTFGRDDPLISDMRSLYAANRLSDADQEYLCFALSKALNDTGAYGEAFHFVLEAARLKKPKFDPGLLKRDVAEAKKFLTKEALAPVDGRGHDTEQPVFIVGMPRSGTTLVEQILSCHREVFAAGELTMIGAINNQMRIVAREQLDYKGSNYGFLPIMPAEHFNNAAGACRDMVGLRAEKKAFTRFTDKMPQNAFHLGLISMMFPNARIIHVRRHPLDTCVSCFFQRFRLGQEYSYRLDWLGRYYRSYAEIFEHWRCVVPLQILDVHYEELVEDPEAGARKILEFVDLEWTDDCIRPQDSKRIVLTASRWQVRQPIYKSSRERWKRYEAWLSPLIDALGGNEWIEAHAARRHCVSTRDKNI